MRFKIRFATAKTIPWKESENLISFLNFGF
nr:MAG TPA: hypothetical protein [Caudoviricetes sp.]